MIFSKIDIEGEDLAVDTQFPHFARDELGVLGAEIENDDYFLDGNREDPWLPIRFCSSALLW